MSLFVYFRLRKEIFSHEIKHWLKQVKHLLLLIIIFLGTALPAFFFMSFLAFGIILNNDGSTLQVLIIVWCILLVQSMATLLSKSAVFATRYQLYLRSLPVSTFTKSIVDCLFALLCTPLLLILIIIIAFVQPSDWHRMPHGFVMLSLQIACLLTCFHSSKRMYTFLIASLLALPLLLSLSLTVSLCVLLTLLGVINTYFVFAPKNKLKLVTNLPLSTQFWLSMLIGSANSSSSYTRNNDKPNALVICLASVSIIVLMAHYSALNMPQYASHVYFIACQLVVFVTASLQLSVNKTIQQHELFFNAYTSSRFFRWGQYSISFALSICCLLVLSMFFASSFVLVHVLSALICIYAGKHYSKFFVFTWLLTCIISVGIVGLITYL